MANKYGNIIGLLDIALEPKGHPYKAFSMGFSLKGCEGSYDISPDSQIFVHRVNEGRPLDDPLNVALKFLA